MIPFIGLPFTSLIKADSARDTVLIKQIRASPTIYGIDTIYRMYNYSVNGTLHSIVDTPRTIFHPAFYAEYDTLGKIQKIREYRDTLINSVEYFWEPENRIRFEKQWNGEQKKESGTIVYYGKLRAVDLPENNSFAPENYLLVKADSTQYLDESGGIITTWVWFYDSLGNNTKWQSRAPGDNELNWVEEYTYRYYDNGMIDRRSPALAGDIIINIYGQSKMNIRPGQRPFKRKDDISNGSRIKKGNYLLNGRKAGKIDNENRRKLPLMIFVRIDSKQNGKSFSLLSGKKE